MFEVLFVDEETGRVNYAITNISEILYVTQTDVGFLTRAGNLRHCPFSTNEKIEIHRKDPH